jgi:hypothetical protein
MASNVANGPTPTPALTRGRSVNLGSLAANTDVVQFSLSQEIHTPNGLECLTIVTVGGTVTAGLEASIDGATTWFGVPPRAATGTAPNYSLTVLNSDTAATSANSYDVSSLQAGATFRFGGRTAGTAVVWALFS